MENLKQRVKKFVAEFSMPITVFAKNIGISANSYYKWMRGDLRLSSNTEKRISEYLLKYRF